jgi:flagellar basal body rod protein FlgC
MTVIVSIALYVFGLNAATGTFNTCSSTKTKEVSNVTVDSTGNIIVYDPNYDAVQHPVYYQYPNIIVPKPEIPPQPPSVWSSDPAYKS